MLELAFSGFGIFITLALTIAGMVLLYLKIIPKNNGKPLPNKFFQALHDYFNFKKLYIEEVLKFLFTLLTVAFIAGGVSTILMSFFGIFKNIEYLIKGYVTFGYIAGSFFGDVFAGILTAIIGPIVIRLSYEGIMMFILLVKNVIEINNKTKTNNKNSDAE